MYKAENLLLALLLQFLSRVYIISNCCEWAPGFSRTEGLPFLAVSNKSSNTCHAVHAVTEGDSSPSS